MNNKNIAELLADNYVKAYVVDADAAYQLRAIVADIAYRLFLKSTESDEAQAELERLITLAASEYGVSITALIRERVEWAKWWDSRYGK